jgi:hypothetical protein
MQLSQATIQGLSYRLIKRRYTLYQLHVLSNVLHAYVGVEFQLHTF